MSEEQAGQTPWEDLRKNTLAHYEEVSARAFAWYSTIPRAINYYFDHAGPASLSEDEYQRGVEDAAKVADAERRKGLSNLKDKDDSDYDDGYYEASQLIVTNIRALAAPEEKQ